VAVQSGPLAGGIPIGYPLPINGDCSPHITFARVTQLHYTIKQRYGNKAALEH